MIFYVIIIRVNKVKLYVFYYIRMCFILFVGPGAGRVILE